MDTNPNSIKKPIWANIIFFALTTAGCVIGAPVYLYRFGISGAEIGLFVFYMVATGLSITVGYHRLFSHANFKASQVVKFLLLFFGAAAFEQTAYRWSAQHRDHHRYVDTDLDPYSIKKGFWYAHIGWLLFWEHKINYSNAKDLEKDPLVMHQHRHYLLWAGFAGILLPVLIGAMTGHALGALILSVCCRITFVYHCTFFINSICHMFGKATYDIYATAKDHWLIAFLTYGEGYHNFHHRFPSDYRNGVRWYQWDPSKWIIALMEKVGLASKLCRVSDFSILSARLVAENRKVKDYLISSGEVPQATKALEILRVQYENIKKRLAAWELAAREYRSLLQGQAAYQTQEIKKAAFEKFQAAKEHFARSYKQWKSLLPKIWKLDLRSMSLNSFSKG